MATPGSSPNKGFLQNLGQGLIGKGNMGFLNPAMFAARGAKNLLDNDPTTGTVFGGGGGDAVANAGLVQGQQPQMMQPNVQVNPMAQGITMKSPMKQENEKKLVAGQYLTPGEEPDTYVDEQEGEGYTDPDGFIEINEEGLVVDNDYIVNEENVIIGVQDTEPEAPQGPMGPGGMGMMGGVGGGGPMEMKSASEEKKPDDVSQADYDKEKERIRKENEDAYQKWYEKEMKKLRRQQARWR